MNRPSLTELISKQKSYLCVGLDTDIEKIPAHLHSRKNPVVDFNKCIIEATEKYCVSYKINTAFYEAHGSKGWDWMAETLEHIPATHFTIADAKRGDIGNTSAQYARAFFETMNFDAITVSPYMGEDSIKPFLAYADKFTIVLGLTSNAGAKNFEMLKSGDKFVYEKVIEKVAEWGTEDNLMFVVGATQTEQIINIRHVIPDHFLLIPGIGAQGGSLKDVSKYAMNSHYGILVNSSRNIIYASAGEDFAEKAADAARDYQQQMENYFL